MSAPEYSAFIPAICFGHDNKILENPFILKPCRHRINEKDLQKYEKVCYCGRAVITCKRDVELQSIIPVCLQNRTVVSQLTAQLKSKDDEMAAYKAQVQPRLEKLEKLEKRALGALNLKAKPEAVAAKIESEPAKEAVAKPLVEASKEVASPSIANPATPSLDPASIKSAQSVPVAPQAMEVIPMIAPAIPKQHEVAKGSIKITLKKPAKRPSEEAHANPSETAQSPSPISQQNLSPVLPTFPKKPKIRVVENSDSTDSNKAAQSSEEKPLSQKKKWAQDFKEGKASQPKPKASAKASAKPASSTSTERMPIPKKPAAPAVQSMEAPKHPSSVQGLSLLSPTPPKPPTNVITFASTTPKAPAIATRVITTIDMTGSMAKPIPTVPASSIPAQTAASKQLIQPQVASDVQAYFGGSLASLAPKDTPQGVEQRKEIVTEVDALLKKILTSKEASSAASAMQEKKQSS